MSKKGKLGIVMNAFRKGEIQVLVGTQMVSKGLDFSHVTLVGVISAETSLWLPDFRADERTIQLLTQVSGRSGRSICAPSRVTALDITPVFRPLGVERGEVVVVQRGLGGGVERLEVTWPNGVVQSVEDVEIDGLTVIEQPK